MRNGFEEPQRAYGLIERPRLLDKLASVLEHRLTLVSAPPGYGKTTLLAQYARRAPCPVVWQSVEERDRDVPNMNTASLLALSTIAPGLLRLQLPEGLPPDDQAAALADALRNETSGHFIYILDDVHLLAQSFAAETWLTTFVARMPPNCHLILSSRILPSLPLAEMIARREVLAVGHQELRFTPPEVHALALQLQGDAPTLDSLQELMVRLEGWPAGVVLALQPLPVDLQRALLSGGDGPEALFDALADAMLAAQLPELRTFLLASSTLMLVTPELCNQALMLPNTSEMLVQAQVRNLFLARVSGGLVYHTLFRNFLQRRMWEQDPLLFRTLHLRAAHWFEQHDQNDSAIDHYLVSERPVDAVRLMERLARAYFAQGKLETLLHWHSELAEIGVIAPLLSFTCARAYTDRYDYEAATAALDEAEDVLTRYGDESRLLEIRLQRAMIHLQSGGFETAAKLAATVAEWETGLPNYQSGHAAKSARTLISPALRGRALRIWGFALVRLGELEKGTELLEQALPMLRDDGDKYALTNLLTDLEIAYTRLGRPDDAAACLREVVGLRRRLGSPAALALSLNNLGFYYHQHSDYRQAADTFSEGLSVLSRTLNRRAEGYLLWSLGDLQRDRGAFSEATRHYERALELSGDKESFLRCSVLISMSILQRWQNNTRGAISRAEEAAKLADEKNLVLEASVARALICVARAQAVPASYSDDALPQLQTIIAEMRGGETEKVRLMGLCAYVALLNQDRRGAADLLTQALSLAQNVGGLQPLIAEILHTDVLRSFIAGAPRRFPVLDHDLKALREAQADRAPGQRYANKAIVPTTYNLRVYALGLETIERDGEKISTSSWRATTARELFLYLMLFGPETRERLGVVFWPESSAKRVRNSFHTTLYRIRFALGENVIIHQDERYLINPDIETWCDAREMDDKVTRAKLLSTGDVHTEELWRGAVALYQGPFLLSINAEWAEQRREHYHNAYIEALIGLAGCLRANGDPQAALENLRRADGEDPYREEIHRAMFYCFADLGQKGQIRVHLEQLKARFYRDLAIAPSPETLDLARRLLD